MPLSDIKAVISDMDGVLWRGDQKLPSMVELFNFMRVHQIPFALATNNSGRHTSNYVQKLATMGVEGITPHQLVTSATATVDYINAHYGEGTRLHVIGNEGLFQTLEEANFIITDRDIDAVVVGLDFNFTYEKARAATLLLRNHGAAFIGTNPDSSFPSPDGLVPGAGSLIRMIQDASDVEPVIIGKPKPAMFEVALARLGTRAEETLMIGDRINTDIEGGNQAGLQTAMVLTGVNQRSDISDIQPDYIFDGLPELLKSWSESM
ncbi:MAG: HAD-IIA family hydrolase [Phototrophicaceae bacterium]